MATFNYQETWNFLKEHSLKNINNSIIADYVRQIRALQAQGDYAGAAKKVAEANATEEYKLEEYILSSDYVNAIDEQTVELEKQCKARHQCIFFDDNMPGVEYLAIGDVWIGEAEVV